MRLESRTLAGEHSYRPEPIVEVSPEHNLALVLSIWGNSDIKNKLVESFYASMRKSSPAGDKNFDPDATQVRGPASQLKSAATLKSVPSFERLIEGLKAVNLAILQQENSRQWRSVVEIAALQVVGRSLHWAVCGEFQVLLRSASQVSVLSQSGHGFSAENSLGPLPLLGLGLESSFAFNQGQAQLNPNSQVMIVNSQKFHSVLLQPGVLTLNDAVDLLTSADDSSPQWIAISDFR